MDVKTFAERLGININDLSSLLKEIGDKKVSQVELIQKTGLSIETLKKFRLYFSDFLLPLSNFYVLNDNGKKLILDLEKNKITFSQKDEEDIRKVLKLYNSRRPAPKRDFDQFYSTPDTQIERLRLLISQNDLANSEVLFLGDDDITSICLGVLGIAKRIVVVDIDPAQLSFIESIAKSEKLKIELYHADLRQELLPELKSKFDVVFTDPPYTPNGFKLFLNRELQALRGNTGTVYICYGTSERSSERLLPIQEIINEYGLAIYFAYHNFNKYTGAESIGSSSNLYVLKGTPKTKFVKKVDLNRIYTYE